MLDISISPDSADTARDLAVALAALAASGPDLDGPDTTRLLLDDPGSVWLLEQGQLDLFVVELLAGGSLGTRRFLWNAEAPAVLCGLAPPPGQRPFALLAVGGSGTRVRRVALDAIRGLADRPETTPAAIAVVETFVAQACAAIGRTAQPLLHARFAVGTAVTLDDGQNAGTDRLLWIWHAAGSSLFAAGAGARISAVDGVIPIAPGAWVKADGGAAHVRTRDTATAWRDGVMWEGLDTFRALFAYWLAGHAIASEASERSRLTRKAEAEQRMLERGVTNLAGVLAQAPGAAVPFAEGDPLLEACRAVGARARIDFQPPPSWEVDRRVRDPLSSICRASRVRLRKVALRGEWWRASGGPLLGYTAEDRRPVALLPVGPTRYELFDPVQERRVPVDKAVSESLDGFAFEFYPPSPHKPITLLDLGRMALAQARGDLARLLLAALAGGLLGLVLPLAISKVFSDIIPMAIPANIVPLLVTLVAFTLASTFFDLTRAMAMIRIEGRMNAALQSTIIDRLLALPVPFFRAFSTGDLAMRAGAINAIRSLLSGAALTTVIEGAFSVINLGLLLYYSWQLTLVAIAVVLVSVVFTGVIAVAAIRIERRHQAAEGAVAGFVYEMIGGIAKLRVAGAERRAFAIWMRMFRVQRDLAFRSGVYENVVSVFNDVLPLVSTLALLATTGYLVTTGVALNTGDFVAFHAAFGGFFASGVQMSDTLIQSLNVIPMMERAQPILKASLEMTAAKPDPGALTGRIEISHVSFRYQPDGPAILRDVTVNVAPGEFVALVGPSGSGKSTLLRLLIGFEPPESGAIYFDEQDLGLLDLGAVRSQMGVVLQSSRLLAGDIFQNIIGSAPLTVEEAWDAAEQSGLAGDIRKMPMGMYTMVSEGGSTLSGGQRQRLMIARALVRRPRIVLFDEATSALDNRTQEIVSLSLERMKATRIVIAHRLSTVRNADRIYVMEAGQIIQQGSYDELAGAPGLFGRMIARQLV